MINKISGLPKYILKSLYTLFAIIVIIVIILLCGIWWLSTDSGQTYVHKMVKNEFAKKVGYQIQAEDISFHFPMNVKVTKLSLSDQKGKWLDVKNISVNILLNPNIHNHLIISNFSVGKFALLRQPQEPKTNIDEAINQKAKKVSEDKKVGNYDIKISVDNINIKEIIIASSLTNLPKDVTLAVDGSIMWDNLNQSITFSNTLQIGQIIPYVSPMKLNLSGKYLLEDANSKTPKIFANIKNDKIKITLPKSLPKPNAKEKSAPTTKNTATSKSPVSKVNNKSIMLDMNLDVDNNIFISGWGLDIEVGGKLKITGDANNPTYIGRLGMVEGKFKQFGRDFKLQKADLVFDGHIPPYPYLDVLGVATIEGIEIMPRLTGPLMHPSFKVNSSSFSKNIISKLLSGDGKSKINTTKINKTAKKAQKEVVKAFKSLFK